VSPEQRLVGLDRDHQALALPIEVLRLLPEEYLRLLSPEVTAEILRRQDMEGYQELMDKMLATVPAEQVISRYAPEQRLAGVSPEQRLVGLDWDHRALALPLEVLQLLPSEYFRSLSPEVGDKVVWRREQDR
jgi:hypothetical protein